MTIPIEPVTAAPDAASAQQQLDVWGNAILDAPGPLGQYRIQSARDGRILRVCGEAATTKHLLFWDYDAGELRMVCRLCWTLTPMPNDEQASEMARGDDDVGQ